MGDLGNAWTMWESLTSLRFRFSPKIWTAGKTFAFCNTIWGEADILPQGRDFRFWRWSQRVDATLYLRGKRWSG